MDFDEVADDEEESQEQRALEKAKKMKEKNVAKQVEIGLCMNIFLQRCVCCCTATSTCFIIMCFAHSHTKLASSFITLERVFAYYCRCIKNSPECFKFRQSIGPKEYALFCQECEITGEGKGKMSIIDSRRVFKQANMEVNEHTFPLKLSSRFSQKPNYES